MAVQTNANTQNNANKAHTVNVAKNAGMYNTSGSTKYTVTEGLTFGVDPAVFTAMNANARALQLFNACSDAFTYGAKNASGNVETPPQLPGDWNSTEAHLISNSALDGQFTKNAGTQGKFSVSFTPAQQTEYANAFGVALAKGLDDAAAGKPLNTSYSVAGSWDASVGAKITAIYTEAYSVYSQGSESVEGDQQTGSNLGRNLLIGIVLAGAAAAGLYWYSKKQGKTAASNPTEDGKGARYAKYVKSERQSGGSPKCFECGEDLPSKAEHVVEGEAGWYCSEECKDQREEGYEFSGKENPNEMQLYQINDEQESITLDEFLADNSELDPEEVEKIRSLKVEETFHSGGGAQPEWKIRRVY